MTKLHLFPGDRGVIQYGVSGLAGGRRVLVHHGLLGSAGFAPEWDALATAAGMEVLTVARPGYGASDVIEMESVSEWAGYVMPLLDHLQWDEFDVIGISAGAAYAYALAALAEDRVRRVAICSGVTHVVDPEVLACYSDEAQVAYQRYAIEPLDVIAGEMASAMKAVADTLEPGHRWLESIEASLAQGAVGMAREARLQIRPWGFEPRDVHQPVHLWHSPVDTEVPFPAMVRTAAKIRSARITVQVEPDHIPSLETGEQVFAFLAADRASSEDAAVG